MVFTVVSLRSDVAVVDLSLLSTHGGDSSRHLMWMGAAWAVFANLLELREELRCGTLGCAVGKVEDCNAVS